MASIINVKTAAIAERSMEIEHIVKSGNSLLIAERDDKGNLTVLLDITAGENYKVTLKGTITDRSVIP